MGKTKVIYLMGMGRSGGTLLGRLLGQHDKAMYVGELRYIWQRGVVDNWTCGCGDSFKMCKVWSSIEASWREEIVNKGLEENHSVVEGLNKSSEFPRIFLNKIFNRQAEDMKMFAAFEKGLYHSISKNIGIETVVESSRYPSRAVLLSLIDSLDVYVVHLIRDPRGVINSQLKQEKKRGGAEKKIPFKRVFHWLAINLMSTMSRAVVARDHYMYLRYEDFVMDPESSIKKILEFSREGAATCPDFDDKTVQLELVHVFSGNENRFSTGSITIKPDTQWIEQLPIATRRFILMMTYFPLKLYGYKKYNAS